MKNLLTYIIILITAAVSLTANAQEVQVDSSNTDSLIFNLDIITITNVDTKELLTGVKIKIIGTDGSSQEFVSDSLGLITTINLKPNTSYSTVLEKKGYLNAKGKETTVGLTQSKNFIHEYGLQEIPGGGCRMLPRFYYHKNEITVFSEFSSEYKFQDKEMEIDETNPIKYLVEIMIENPTIVIGVWGYRDESEKNKTSKIRAKTIVKYMVKLGIDKDRFEINDGGVLDFKPKLRKNKEWSEKRLEQENRTVHIKVIRDDYIKKLK